MEGIPPQILDLLFVKRVPIKKFPEQASRLALGFDVNIGPMGHTEKPLVGAGMVVPDIDELEIPD